MSSSGCSYHQVPSIDGSYPQFGWLVTHLAINNQKWDTDSSYSWTNTTYPTYNWGYTVILYIAHLITIVAGVIHQESLTHRRWLPHRLFRSRIVGGKLQGLQQCVRTEVRMSGRAPGAETGIQWNP
jgi:hypothetical protein